MKKIVFTFLILGGMLCTNINSQTPQQNLQKYWNYRKRLENRFVWVSAGNEAGSNLPAESRNDNSGTMRWDDGNNCFPTYLGMLATEYKLLMDHGHDVSRTRLQLYYALLALERLDYVAEEKSFAGRTEFASNCSDYNGTTWPAANKNLNGYFVRDDVDATTINAYQFKNIPVSGCEANMLNGGTGAVMSKDVCWNTLIGLALVKTCVGTDQTLFNNIINQKQTIPQMVDDICEKMLYQLYGGSYADWNIHSPISGCTISYPSNSGALFENISPLPTTVPWAYGFCKAVESIDPQWQDIYLSSVYSKNKDAQGAFENIENDEVTIDKEIQFFRKYGLALTLLNFNILDAVATYIADKKSPMNDWSFLALNCVMGTQPSFPYLKNVYENDPYNKYSWTYLLYEVLHREGQVYNTTDVSMQGYLSNLNTALPNGPDYSSKSVSIPSYWNLTNVLTQSSDAKGEDINGLDYMLLHNLWWLVYDRMYSHRTEILSSSVESSITTKNIDNSFTSGTQSSPAAVTGDFITATNQLDNTRNVTYQANNSITLNPYAPQQPHLTQLHFYQ